MKAARFIFVSSATLLACGLRADAAGIGAMRAAGDVQDGVGSIRGRVLLGGDAVPEWDSVTNTIVFLVGDGLEGVEPQPGASPPILEQRDYTFIPHVLATRFGVELTITNRDTVTHNIHVFTKSRGRTVFNRAQNAGVTMRATFRRPDSLLVLCDIHSYMQAHILVLPNSVFTKPNEDGSFILEGVPAGAYELVAWHKYYTGRRAVEVLAGESTRTDIDLAVAPSDIAVPVTRPGAVAPPE
ncbi:MAG: carboxypeptidase regulatory-like domain-containing protein [Gemmatimonadota bacterium]